MKATLSQIFNNWQAIGKLATLELPAKKAYGLSRFLRDATTHYEDVEKQRAELVNKYGVKDKDGNAAVTPDNLGEFVREFGELLSVEVEVYDPQLTLESLESAKMSAATFFGLTWLIDGGDK